MRTRPFLTLPATVLLLGIALIPFCPDSLLGADKPDDATRPLLVLKGHRENVFGIVFSPDGKQLVTVSGDPSIKVWDASSGKTLKTFAEGTNGHKQIILGVAVRPDGGQFLTASADNTLKVWDMPTSNALREIVVAAAPRVVATSADGTRLAAGCADGKLRLWNTADAKLTGEIDIGPSPLTQLAFAANGQTLATLAEDGVLRLINPAGNTLLARFAAHPGLTTGLGFSPGNNALFTTGTDGTLKTWALPSPAAVAIAAESVPFLDTATDGSSYLFTVGKSVRLGSLTKGELRGTYASDVDLTCATASGSVVAAGTTNRDVLLWQAKETKLVGRVPAHNGPVTSVSLNAAGNQLATAGKDGFVRVWALPVAPSTKIDAGGPVTAAFLLPDGKQFFAASSDKNIRLLKSTGGLERQFSGHTAAVRAITLLSDNKTLASAGDEGAIRLWGAKAETVHQVIGHTGPIVTLAPLGDRLLSAGSDGAIKVWSLSATPPPAPLAHPGLVSGLVVLPDGSRFLTGCDDKQVRLWNMTNDKTERLFSGPTLGILSVAANRSGDRIAAGSADKSVHIWETNSGKVVAKIAGLSAAIRAVAFSGDGKRLVAGLADGTLKTYDAATGKEVKTLTAHKGAVNAIAVTSRGDAIVSAGEDGQLLTQPIEGGAATPTKLTGPATAVVLHATGTPHAVAVGKSVQRFGADGKVLPALELGSPVRSLALNADGKRLAVACEDGRVHIEGPDGFEESHPHEAAVVAVAFSTDGKRILSAADKTARHRPLNLAWQTRLGGALRGAQLSPRGDRIAALTATGELHFLNATDGKPLAKQAAHKSGGALVYRSDAAQLATVGDRELKLWDLAKPDAAPKTVALEAAPSLVAYTPDGKRLAVALAGPKASTHRIAILDATEGRVLTTYGDGDSLSDSLSANVLRWGSDNRSLHIAGDDRQFRTIDVNLVAAFPAHPEGVSTVRYLPSGNLVTSGADKTIRLFTTAGKREKDIAKLTDVPPALAASFDGTLVAATVGKKATVWNIADGKEVASFETPTSLGALGFSADKQRLAAAGADGRARVFDLTSKREVQAFLHNGAVTALTWSRSQPTHLFTAGADKQLVLNTVSLTRQTILEKSPRALAVSNSGAFVVVASDDGSARRFNANSGALEKDYPAGDKPLTAVAITRNEATVATASNDGTVTLFGSGDGKRVSAIKFPVAVRAMQFTPDNKGLVVALANGVIEGRDVAYTPGAALPETMGEILQSFAHGTEVRDLAVQGKETTFWTTGSDKSLKAWKLASETPLQSFAHPNSVNAVVYTPDGKRAVTACSDGKMRTFDLTKNTPLKTVEVNNDKDASSVYGVAVNREGSVAACAIQSNGVKLVDLEGGKVLREIKPFDEKTNPKGHRDSVLCVTFSPDGKQIATGGMDQSIKIWNVADGALARELIDPTLKTTAHPGWVYALRWTGDGKHLVAVGAAPKLRGYVSVWEPAAGKRVSGGEVTNGTIYSVTLSPDEKWMAIGTGGTVRSETHQGLLLRIPGR